MMGRWAYYTITQQGSINNANNYRGITLLSCLGKLFTQIPNSRLSNWAENYIICR